MKVGAESGFGIWNRSHRWHNQRAPSAQARDVFSSAAFQPLSQYKTWQTCNLISSKRFLLRLLIAARPFSLLEYRHRHKNTAYSPQNRLQAYGKAEAQGALAHALLGDNTSLIHGMNQKPAAYVTGSLLENSLVTCR